MNYGFEPSPFDYALEVALRVFCSGLPKDNLGRQPYVERDKSFPGVRIRRLTHYDDPTVAAIVKRAEEIFQSVKKDYYDAQAWREDQPAPTLDYTPETKTDVEIALTEEPQDDGSTDETDPVQDTAVEAPARWYRRGPKT